MESQLVIFYLFYILHKSPANFAISLRIASNRIKSILTLVTLESIRSDSERFEAPLRVLWNRLEYSQILNQVLFGYYRRIYVEMKFMI